MPLQLQHIAKLQSLKGIKVSKMKYDAITLSSSSSSSICSSGSLDSDFENITANDKSNRSIFNLLAIAILAASAVLLSRHRCNGNAQDSQDYGEHIRPLVDSSSSSSSSSPLPDIAWLMSFPNSGTSYTMRLVQAVSNTTAATNYAEECKQDSSGRVATLFESPSGPYLRQQVLDGGMPLPKRYILTKTHCGGRCVHCIPERYVETRNSFLDKCLTGTLTGPTVLNEPSFHMNTVDTPMNRTHVHYSPTKVKRAIHLVRHPFNNIVARFHLEFNNHKSVGDFTTRFPSNRSGFRAWCQDLDQRYHRKESKTDLISSEVKSYFDGVPCHSEFFRYTQWHNLALQVTEKLNIPTHFLYYEDYQEDFESTLDGILQFLELKRVGKASPFICGKTYNEYYTKGEQLSAMYLVKALSTPQTWSLLKRYTLEHVMQA